ncbi:phage tail protein [Enterobacter cancerogenus]|uniref:phage tail-collar fiber domain-containing protein n=1 Tax=Enterobacter cancerogenus TaxID=69218 RepID=UPI003808A6A8
MTVKYKTVITKAGAEKLAAATVPNGKKVNFAAMAIGDGSGTLPTPDPNQTKLVNEVWRHALNKISQDNKHKNYVVAELLIPPERGGFWMRELGLYDDTGTLIAVGNMAESYKPALAEGSGRAQTVRMVIMVSDIESVELTIDTSMVMATQDYVDDRLAEHEQSRRHPDATLTAKGFTQLSSATDSASESVAATPKAVKAAYDLAKGKYTAQDATTAQKGVVQLSSATDSTSEALAATPKAVKAANDNANGRVPSGRKVNGRELAADITITAQDIFNGQAVGIGNAEDLNAYTTPGLYYQAANAQAQTGRNYPEANAGSLEVYKHAGITQIYRIYSSSRSYIRTLYSGTWSGWVKQYDAANKPTAGDVGAVAKAGDAMTGKLTINIDGETILLRPKTAGAASYIISRDSSGANHWYVGAGSTNNADTVFNNYKGGNNNVQLKADGSVTLNPVQGKSVIANGPVQIGGIGTGILNIGDNDSGLRSSKDGQVDLWANSKMFGYWNTTTFSFTGQIIPTNYSNFDARFIIADSASYAGFASNDATRPYMRHKASNAVVELTKKGDAYTKAESDGRFQPKGSYTPTGTAYTKAESDARFQKINSASRAANGWYKDANTGMIFQWGVVSSSVTGNVNITFPTAFPSACVNVQNTIIRKVNDGAQNNWTYVTSFTKTGASVGCDGHGVYWFAVGY